MLKQFIRLLLEPFARLFRAFFDPRFGSVESRLASDMEAQLAPFAASLDVRLHGIEHRIAIIEEGFPLHLRAIEQRFAEEAEAASARDEAIRDVVSMANQRQVESSARISEVEAQVARLMDLLRGGGDVGDLHAIDAEFLNYAESHRGFRAQRHLWFNHPDIVRYSQGEVELSALNERTVETPFVIEAVARNVPPQGSILDVGCGESLLCIQLASLGYDVTGIDLHEYPLHHPGLTTVALPLAEWRSRKRFDAVICLSSIEHFGLGAYGEEQLQGRLDLAAVAGLLQRVKEGGVLILTTPYGRARVTELERIYDAAGLSELLKGWSVVEARYAHPEDDAWLIRSEPDTADRPGVALVVARPDA